MWTRRIKSKSSQHRNGKFPLSSSSPLLRTGSITPRIFWKMEEPRFWSQSQLATRRSTKRNSWRKWSKRTLCRRGWNPSLEMHKHGPSKRLVIVANTEQWPRQLNTQIMAMSTSRVLSGVDGTSSSTTNNGRTFMSVTALRLPQSGSTPKSQKWSCKNVRIGRR